MEMLRYVYIILIVRLAFFPSHDNIHHLNLFQQEKLKDGAWNFTCQHGPNECRGNKIQSCGLYFLQKKPSKQIKFAACFMGQNVYPFNLTVSS